MKSPATNAKALAFGRLMNMSELDTTETIAELFQRAGSKPDTLTTKDLDRLIEHYRASRAAFKDKGTAATKTDKPAPDLKELGF
jgi:hypothetical protein